MLKNELIEKALALTVTNTEDMMENIHTGDCDSLCGIIPEFESKLSIEKFCYYLLSHKFLYHFSYIKNAPINLTKAFGRAIYDYQDGNEKPLSDLLSKIKE